MQIYNDERRLSREKKLIFLTFDFRLSTFDLCLLTFDTDTDTDTDS